MKYKINHSGFIVLIAILVGGSGCQGNQKPLAVEQNEQETQDIVDNNIVPEITDADEALNKARKARSVGKIDLAQAYYIRAYNIEPDNVQTLKEMADFYRQLNNGKLELVAYRLILEKDPNNLQIMERFGLLLIQQKQMSEAEKVLNNVVGKAQSWKAYNGLGIIADLAGEHRKARIYFDKAGTIAPNNPEVLNNIGYSLYMEGEIKKAQGYFLWAIKVNKQFKKAIYNYALTLARQRHYSEALAIFSKVMTLPEANNNTGYLAMKNGDYDEAEFYLQQAVKLSPRFYQKAHLNIEELHQLSGLKKIQLH